MTTRILLLLLFFPTLVYGQTTDPTPSEDPIPQLTDEWKTFYRPDFSIAYPSMWELNSSGLMGTSFIALSQIESEQDRFRENVNLVIQDLTGMEIDLNKYTELSETEIRTMVDRSDLIESSRINTDTLEYHKIVYTGYQGDFHLRFEQHYYMIGEKVYLLTFTSEQYKFETFKEMGGKILKSFELKE